LGIEKYALIITEKPDAARRIAVALDLAEKARRIEDRGVPYYVAVRDRKIVIVPSLGHLYTVAARGKKRNHYPVFSFRWVPRYLAEQRSGRIRTWLQVIKNLSRNAGTFIDACDYDLEGSIIGYCILKYACNNKEKVSKRMKFSTLTKEELQKSYNALLPQLDFALVEAGKTRHEVDWLYGINLSRALTTAREAWSGKYTKLSTGRVQGPLLKFLVSRETAIRTYVPMPYWKIKAQAEISGSVLELQYSKGIIKTKREAETVSHACEKKKGLIEGVAYKRLEQPPPTPFDLGTLQIEAYSLFGYAPRRTSIIAQHLYLQGLISYPRTNSQKLPSTINYKAILQKLNKVPEFEELIGELLIKSGLVAKQGNKDDPAHPAIYPTGNLPEKLLDKPERNVWSLIVRRFMAVFGEPAIKESLKARISVSRHSFHVEGMRTLEQGWKRFYEPFARSEDTLFPLIEEGQAVNIKKVIGESKFTEPVPRYNPSSLLQKMEHAEIGTKATRADIIQTLYDRGYVRNERMVVTDLGFEVFAILKKHCPNIVSPEMTRELEARMNRILEGKEKRKRVLMSTVEILAPVLEELKKSEKIIGEQLSFAINRVRLEKNIIGACPACKTGKLVVLHSRKTGKRFIGCTNHFEGLCNNSFPLPQRGVVEPLGKNCRKCGWPMLQVLTKAGRPWTVCFNPSCATKNERTDKLEMQNM
jgi:DNA topoisomerase-1